MKVIVDLCVVPLGVGVSVSRYVAACERILAEAGLKIKMHSYGTNIEGEWDEVFLAVKQCHETLHQMGAREFLLISDWEPVPTAIRPWRIKSTVWKND